MPVAKELTPKQIKSIREGVGTTHPSLTCPFCQCPLFFNDIKDIWCTKCDYSNNERLRHVLKIINKGRSS